MAPPTSQALSTPSSSSSAAESRANPKRPMTPFEPMERKDLLTADGDLTEEFTGVLGLVFLKYANYSSFQPGGTTTASASSSSGPASKLSRTNSDTLLEVTRLAKDEEAFNEKLKGSSLSDDDLNRYAVDTNGMPFPEETFEEIKENFVVTDDGRLTFDGFCQLYQLQTTNDEEETWRDLKALGFNERLELVSTRKEDLGVDEGEPVPLDRLNGVGMGGTVKGEDGEGK